MTQRSILHVDMDAFYAAIEQRDEPSLKGKPVIIAHSGKRGVVSTASYEARSFGVRSALPTSVARRLCPDGVYIEPRLSYYSEVSRAVFAVFARFTPQIEGLSLDEAFLDVTQSRALFGEALQIGQQIKAQVFADTQLNCSVGSAHNKLLAKMASELSKPNGLLQVDPDQVNALLDPLPVGRLWTMGKVAEDKLHQLGICSIGQLRTASVVKLQKIFGSHTAVILKLANGQDQREVEPERQEISLGAEYTFAEDLQSLSAAKTQLMNLCEKVGARLRGHSKLAQTLQLKLRIPPFETFTRQRALATASAQTSALYQHAEQLLEHWWQERTKVEPSPRLRLLGVSGQNLCDESEIQLNSQTDLFQSAKAQAQPSKTDSLVDSINAKFSGLQLRRARGLGKSDSDGDAG